MFDRISRRYDLLNHLLSLNLDRRWRRAAAAELPEDGAARVLDLCGGTGDLSVALARSGRAGAVVCCDFSHAMLTLAGPKFDRKRVSDRCLVLEADGLRLPFDTGTFDAVTVAFGVRNLADMDAGFREIHRVLRPGGRLIVLEFSRPTTRPLAALYRLYLRWVVPRLGDGISGRSGPYVYLARTISDFPDPPDLAGRIREAGFAACGWQPMSGGIVATHTAFKAPAGR
jgi:demethylmenaquinone methyltransferase/2-methoxy-6-polyprenyl-1,4-benzoquinol methylase